MTGQLHPLQCAAGAWEPALGAGGGLLGRWFIWSFSFDAFWSISDREAPLRNQSAQSPANECVTSPRYATGYSKVKCSLCSVQQVWWSLYWVLRQGWVGGLWGLRFLLLSGVFQLRRRRSAATVHRTLPVCEWLALGVLRVTGR